jgi:flavin reductase (DIM6/NTAB) family NADH-FMN oxidoreductase RutF
LNFHFEEKDVKESKDIEGIQKFMKRIEEGAFLVVKGKERTNVMTIGWALIGVVWRRPVMMVAVRTSRYTYQLIEKADSFTVSVPSGDMKKEINLCGSKSGRDLDKFKECGLSAAKSQKVSSSVLKIPGYHFECRIINKAPTDPEFLSPDLENIYPAKDYHTLYFGEILASYRT